MNPIVVYNDKAGALAKGAESPTAESIRAAFARAGVEVEIRGVSADRIAAELRDAVSRKPSVIYVGGGDGTISTAAGILANTDIALGVLPLGTLNHFARDLGIPPSWEDAIAALAHAPVRRVDLAEVNGRVFINNCSLGSYAEAVRRRDALRREKGHGKWLAMFLASWAVFKRLRRLRLHIETADGPRALRTPFVLISNNRYSGTVLDSSLRPRLDEGRLWIYTTRAHRHGALIRLIWQTLTRRIDAADALEVNSHDALTISVVRGTLPVAADGEVLDVQPPLRFKIQPAALRVLTPPTATQTE